MALYTTPGPATVALGRVAGLTVPSTSGGTGMDGGSAMDDYIAAASSIIETHIGYIWAPLTGLTQTFTVTRDGQGQLEGINERWFPMTGVSDIAVPKNSQYYGPALNLNFLEWSPAGKIYLGYPINFSQQFYVNPVPMIQAINPRGYGNKVYPDLVTLTYNAGRSDAPPPEFRRVCHKLMTILIRQDEDSDMLTHDRAIMKQSRFGLETQEFYKQDAILDACKPLNRYQR